jgi:hypothetical protein
VKFKSDSQRKAVMARFSKDNRFALYYSPKIRRVVSDEIPNVSIKIKSNFEPKRYVKALNRLPDEHYIGLNRIIISPEGMDPDTAGEHKEGTIEIRHNLFRPVMPHELGHNLLDVADEREDYKKKLGGFRKYLHSEEDINGHFNTLKTSLKLAGLTGDYKEYENTRKELEQWGKEKYYREAFADEYRKNFPMSDDIVDRVMADKGSYASKKYNDMIKDDVEYAGALPTIAYPTIEELTKYAGDVE